MAWQVDFHPGKLKLSEFSRYTLPFGFATSFLPTVCIVRREGNVFTRVCPSIHPSICPQGGTPARGGSQPGPAGRYPTSGTPLSGVPPPPSHFWCQGYPPARSDRGVPLPGGTPPQPPSSPPPHLTCSGDTLPGGTPLQGTDGVLDMPRSICLLRSCSRTFLFLVKSLSLSENEPGWCRTAVCYS